MEHNETAKPSASAGGSGNAVSSNPICEPAPAKMPLYSICCTVYTVYMHMHSWLTISATDPRPLYTQLIEQIRRRVAVGDLPPGTELPSIRQLAAELQISVITVKRAYLELEHDGVINTRHGKGSVVADNPKVQTNVQQSQLQDHLQQAVQLGILLGKSKSEMQRCIAQAYEQVAKDQYK